MIRRLLAATLAASAMTAGAQSVPAANFSDMWWNPAESGWGISLAQHVGSHEVFAVWYTYDPRELAASGQHRPLWIVMPGGTWTTPTRLTGSVYVTNGVPFNQSGSNPVNVPVGTFTFVFSDASNGTFTYNISAPANQPSSSPAFNLPAMSGNKAITRQSF
jgi:hypothetical protein